MRQVERYTLADIPHSLTSRLNELSFFGSPGFVKLWESMNGTGVYWVVRSGERVVATMPGVEFRQRPFTRFQSMVDGCYTGCACDAVFDNSAMNAEELMGAVARAGYAKIVVNDYWRGLVSHPEYRVDSAETMLVNIQSPDWQPPDQKLCSEIRKAEREGVQIKPFAAVEHMDKFLHLMKNAESRHGRKPKYPPEFFASLARLAESDDRVQWRCVECEGELAVSHINFRDGRMVLNWQIYFDKRFSHLKANQYMLYRTAVELAQGGGIHLNLGASPPEAESLVAYKEKWGGNTYSYPVYQRHSWIGKLW